MWKVHFEELAAPKIVKCLLFFYLKSNPNNIICPKTNVSMPTFMFCSWWVPAYFTLRTDECILEKICKRCLVFIYFSPTGNVGEWTMVKVSFTSRLEYWLIQIGNVVSPMPRTAQGSSDEISLGFGTFNIRLFQIICWFLKIDNLI